MSVSDGTGLVEDFVRGACGKKLDDLVFAMRDHVVPPLQLPPTGAGAPVEAEYQMCAVLVEDELAGLAASEVGALRACLPWHLAESPHLVEALLEVATSPGYYSVDPAVFSARDVNARLYRTHPDLFKNTDADGLLHIERYDARSQAVFHDEAALIYHTFLRRNFTGSVNDPLIRTLLQVQRNGSTQLRLALNEQHFMPATEFSEYLERDYWFGPPLSSSVLDDPRILGVTMHGDPQTGLGHEYPRLIVAWTLNKEGNKVVKIEELSDHPSADQCGLRLLRYLHAIRDVRRGVFIHCDGAVRAYTPQQYEARAIKQFVTGRESAARYRKVFRLDGDIEANAWSNIAAQWFRGNRLIVEYLEGITAETADVSAQDMGEPS